MSRRSFKVGEHPDYDRRFDLRKRESSILNPNYRVIDQDVMQLSSKVGVKSLLYYLVGDERGMVNDRRNTYLMPSKIKVFKDRIKRIEEDFEGHKQDMLNQGRKIPEEMPKAMREQYDCALAELDVLMEEKDKLERLLKEFDKKEANVSEGRVLQHGPIGSGKLKDGILIEIDSQRVSQRTDGRLFIDDVRSRYNRMLVEDYHEFVVQPWKAACRQLRAKERERSLESGKPIDRSRLRAPLPEVPSNVKLLEASK